MTSPTCVRAAKAARTTPVASLGPSVEDMRASIAAINGAELVGRIEKDLSPADRKLLRELVRTHRHVDQFAVQAALCKCNEANSAILSTRAGRLFIRPAQQHHATADADVVITGTFPVTT